MSLVLKCKECGREFSSVMLYDEHIKKNSRENFLELFGNILQKEIDQTQSSVFQNMMDTVIIPELARLKASARKMTTEQKRQNPNLANHKKTK